MLAFALVVSLLAGHKEAVSMLRPIYWPFDSPFVLILPRGLGFHFGFVFEMRV
jgi:hypothetical protein